MPSLYESTAAVGDVASSNFTTLYNASNLTVPNAGAGSVSGNLNVAGNLTVQGTSLLVGAVTLGNTLSLPNYTFPLNDGSTDQVLTTDGSGNLYFTSVSALGASYTIQADTATGGADLTLVSSGGVFDSVKFAGGTNITVSRTDANTITISSTNDTNTTYTIDASATTGGANFNLVGSDSTTDTIKFAAGANMSVVQTDANTITISGLVGPLPSGNQGNVLYNDGSNWIASSAIEFANSSYRPAFINNNPAATSIAAAEFLKRQATLDNGDSAGVAFGEIVGSTKTFTHRLLSSYNSTGANNNFRIQADASGTFTGSEYAQLYLDNNQLSIYGTEFKFLRSHTGAPTQNASITVERGTSTDASLIWDEGNDRWSFSNTLNINGALRVVGQNAYINATGIVGNSYLYLKGEGTAPGTDQYILWNEAQQRIFLSNDTRIDGGLFLKGDYITLNADNTAGLNSSINANAAATGVIRWNYAGSFWEFTNNGGTNWYPFVININDLNDVVITAPTAAGQFLYNNGTNWVNGSTVTATATGDRATFVYKPTSPTAGVNAAVFARKDFGSTAFTNGDGSAIAFQVDSDSQATTTVAYAGALYNSTSPQFVVNTSTDNFATNNIRILDIDSTTTSLNGQNVVLNANAAAGADSYLTVNRGATDVSIRWNEATDRWQDTTDGSTYYNLPNQNLDTTDDVNFSSVTVDGVASFNSQTTTTTSTTPTAIGATPISGASARRTAKYVISVTDSVTNEYHVVEALIFHDGTNAFITTYAEMYTGAAALANFTADISGGNMRLVATPASANSTTFKVMRNSIAV